VSAEGNRYGRLVRRGLLSAGRLQELLQRAEKEGTSLEELLLAAGVPKHEILLCLAGSYHVPFIEFDESVIVSRQIVRRMDWARLKQELWLPLSISGDTAEVILCRPDDPGVIANIFQALGVRAVTYRVALPADLLRIIEHNRDLNPGFPPEAGRTPLARVRTFLADRRSLYACHRTALAKGRTGLAFLRTGLSFMAMALVLFRVFGTGYLAMIDGLLFISGMLMAFDGITWYLPARRIGSRPVVCRASEPAGGTSVLAVSNEGDAPLFSRSAPVPGADTLRKGWNSLSPVMRRRFLASDRTDLAEERTVLACFRTLMARARTGLSFTRTGFAFIGLGIALFRQFPSSRWTIADAVLILIGVAMVAEGLFWYLPGRRAAAESSRSMKGAADRPNIWDNLFPPLFAQREGDRDLRSFPPVKEFSSPGIWATTGLALERTILAERRNVMARLRTVMARARTGLAFIRTGMNISAVGLGLLVYFGSASAAWAVFDGVLIISGALIIADGIIWYLPAERTRQQFPYCFHEMEIAMPDYGVPNRSWGKAAFSHDDLEND